ncbi:hypothetical protein EK21DRAFT_92641 [Setomelanomma holmii]|uniref:Uncharacterized protein n=1 Tax=Setomelanomma holmii TaxID=210430 RepID=A0A9P4LJN0_9PLEO|nr:hypothetical protein EK21DRAFT_92641 [Setomelanomma holmii]
MVSMISVHFIPADCVPQFYHARPSRPMLARKICWAQLRVAQAPIHGMGIQGLRRRGRGCDELQRACITQLLLPLSHLRLDVARAAEPRVEGGTILPRPFLDVVSSKHYRREVFSPASSITLSPRSSLRRPVIVAQLCAYEPLQAICCAGPLLSEAQPDGIACSPMQSILTAH